MTGNDMLSQEEINALLKKMSAEDESPDQTTRNQVENYLTPDEIDTIGEIGNIAFGSASTALSTLLRNKVEITTPEVEIITQGNLEEEFPMPYVAVQVQYTDGFDGDNLLIIHTRDARIIADLMLGGDGSNPPEFGEMEISACQEAMNQMMGSAATSMSTIFNKLVNITPPIVDVIDLQTNEGIHRFPDDEIMVKVSFRIRVSTLIDSKIMQIISVPFAKDMVAELMGGMASNQPMSETTVQPAMQPSTDQTYETPVEQSFNEPYQQSQYGSVQNNVIDRGGMQNMDGVKGRQGVKDVQFASFEQPGQVPLQANSNLDLLLDIPLQVSVELGRTRKLIKEILEMGPGSIIELDKLAGEPVDILVNNKLIAKGEVVVIEENFGVRVTDIVSQWERIQKLQY